MSRFFRSLIRGPFFDLLLVLAFVALGPAGSLAQLPSSSAPATSTTAPADAPRDVKLNIFAVLSPEIEAAVRAVSQDLMDQEGLSTFPQLGFQIHCTLYMTNYPPAVLDELVSRVKAFAATTRAFPARTTRLQITKDNWFFLDLERDRNLQSLSDAIVGLASPLRSPTSFIPEWAKDNPEKVECIKQYGSPNVFSQFEPHLTLLANADGEALARFLAKNGKNPAYALPIAGQVIAIGIGEADRKGQIATPSAIFPLLPASAPTDLPTAP
ncbi:MAG: hypothetical protein OZSIB_3030 [Candidatus Ozemobacter sibiricus]|uniref:Uncharacterized protein n=1 Tax=Candidatus Ozemobacter sibiricus TaxID=2268124 RepID=A0A367ZS91_9BACT|nr:MAG: hypothetical protein OZSIB_3030 [Candidatus Ozemobacter sibiricus]